MAAGVHLLEIAKFLILDDKENNNHSQLHQKIVKFMLCKTNSTENEQFNFVNDYIWINCIINTLEYQ